MNEPIKTYDAYEIVKVPFPFTDTKTTKVRPALILSSAKSFNSKIGLSMMAMITCIQPDRELWPSDIVIENLQLAGLPVPSIIKFKIFTLDHRLIMGRLGNLSKRDKRHVQDKPKEVFF